MDFGKFLFSKRTLRAILLRVALYLTPFAKRVSNLPFVSSSFSSYDKLKEAFFFIENGQNPYEIEHIFQKPLTTLIFYQLRMSEFATLIVFILFDLMIAHLLEQDVFTKRNLQQTEKNKQNGSTWSMIYLFNPITIYNCLTLSTQSLDYLLALTSIYFTFNKSILVGSTIFGAALYQNPQMALIFPVLFLASKSTEKRHAQTSSIDITTIILSVIISLATFGGLVYLSFLVTQSWSFFESCYYRIFFLNYFEPNLSLAWNLHASMFNKYRDLYFATLTLFQLFMILPLYLLFKKFLLSKKAQAGYIGVLSGFCFAVILMLAPSTTLYEFAFCITMLCMQIEILYRIKFILLFDHVFIFALLGTGYTTYSWKNSFTAEPSWIFLQTAVFYGCYVSTLSEVVTSLKHEIIESEPSTENINPSI